MRGFYPVPKKRENISVHSKVVIKQPSVKPSVVEPVAKEEIKEEDIEIIEIIPLKPVEVVKNEFASSKKDIDEDLEQIKQLQEQIQVHKQEIEDEKKELAEKVPLIKLSRFELMRICKDKEIKFLPSDKKEDLIVKITKVGY